MNSETSAVPGDFEKYCSEHGVGPAPVAGTGLNNWLFATAARLFRTGSDPETVRCCLSEAARQAGRLDHREIGRAVRSAFHRVTGVPFGGVLGTTGGSSGEFHAATITRWPTYSPEAAQKVFKSALSVEHLRTLSPCALPAQDPKELLPLLFKPTDLICMGLSQSIAHTRPLSEWLRMDLSRHQLIVPNPMSRPFGETQEGRQYCRTLNNTGPRRYLVIEFDKHSMDEQAAIIEYLMRRDGVRLKLRLCVHSGGKSIHSWWELGDVTEEDAKDLMDEAVYLGADRATWTRCQFVRLPGGYRRDKGTRQTVVYLDFPGVGSCEGVTKL